MAEEFDPEWLDLREPFDAQCRSEALVAKLIARLPARPRLLDLGCGTGSLFRWLAPQIGRSQAWTIVDHSADVVEDAFETIADRAEGIGLKVTFPGKRTMLVHAPGGAWRVEGLIADLNDAPGNLPLHSMDAVVNSALCDLVSLPWLEKFAAALRVPFYAALCVDGRDRFLPPHPADAIIAAGFRRDQARDKGFGHALGPQAAAAIEKVFAAKGYAVSSCTSDWRIPRMATEMLTELVQGHAGAAAAQNRRMRGRIASWHAARLADATRMRLTARIGHRDVLAMPPPR